MFNVSLVNATVFNSFGLPVPSTPVTAQMYAKNGYPFFKMYEEPTGIYGRWSVKTVAELDVSKGSTEPHESEKDLEFRTIEIGNWEQLLSQSVGKIELGSEEEKSMFVPFHPYDYSKIYRPW